MSSNKSKTVASCFKWLSLLHIILTFSCANGDSGPHQKNFKAKIGELNSCQRGDDSQLKQ